MCEFCIMASIAYPAAEVGTSKIHVIFCPQLHVCHDICSAHFLMAKIVIHLIGAPYIYICSHAFILFILRTPALKASPRVTMTR